MSGLIGSLPVNAEVRLTDEIRDELLALPSLRGRPFESPDELRNRVVLVTFFASWCPPCLSEFAHLNDLREAFADSQLVIVAVNVHEQWDGARPDSMARFLETAKPSFKVLKGGPEIRAAFGGIDRIPTVFVFAPSGASAMHFIHHTGAKKTHATLEELSEAVEGALASQ